MQKSPLYPHSGGAAPLGAGGVGWHNGSGCPSVYYQQENDQLSWKKRLIILQLFRVVRNEPHSVIAGAARLLTKYNITKIMKFEAFHIGITIECGMKHKTGEKDVISLAIASQLDLSEWLIHILLYLILFDVKCVLHA